MDWPPLSGVLALERGHYRRSRTQMAAFRLVRINILRRSIGTLHHPGVLAPAPVITIRGSFCSTIGSLEGFVSHLLRNKKRGSTADFDKWTQADIDNHLNKSFLAKDADTVNDILTELIEAKRLPSDAVILRLLSHLCDKKAESMGRIVQIIEVVKETNVKFYATNKQFAPFLSQYQWRLQNFDEALRLLNDSFRASKHTRPTTVHLNYRQLIIDAVQNQDDTVVRKVADGAKLVADRYNDPVLLICLWTDCFHSRLFRNHVIADELFDVSAAIRRAVAKDICRFIVSLLDEHNVSALQRLMELCLKHELKDECSLCLFALFDYHCEWR